MVRKIWDWTDGRPDKTSVGLGCALIFLHLCGVFGSETLKFGRQLDHKRLGFGGSQNSYFDGGLVLVITRRATGDEEMMMDHGWMDGHAEAWEMLSDMFQYCTNTSLEEQFGDCCCSGMYYR